MTFTVGVVNSHALSPGHFLHFRACYKVQWFCVTSLQVHFMTEHVLTPLQSLLSLFQAPLHLTHKRRDKLLDYDHMQYALEHAEEPEKIKQLREDCLLAKRNYEALNEQLLEELPHFLQLALKLLQHTLTVLVQAQYAFHKAVCDLLETLSGGIEQSTEIQQTHVQEIAKISHQLVQLSLVPASLAMNFTTSARRVSESSETSESPTTSPPSHVTTMPEIEVG